MAPRAELLSCLGIKDEVQVGGLSAALDPYVVAKISSPRGDVVLRLVIAP